MIRRLYTLIVTVLFVFVAAACARSPRSEFYTLKSEPMPRLVAPVTPPAIVIDMVTVPEMVERPQLVLRVSPAQVTVDEFARWAQPLKSQIADVLAADLGELFPDSLVFSAPRSIGKPAVHVSINVQVFDSSVGESAVLVALWSVRYADAKEASAGKCVVHEPVSGQGYDALVDAHSRALATLSRELSNAIVAGMKK